MATATWHPPEDLREWLDGIGDRVEDFSPVMQAIAIDLEQFVEDVVFPTSGEGEWEELSPETLRRHPNRAGGILQLSGDLRRRTGRDWSSRNAVVINRMPHAHLAVYGTKRYRTPMWQSKRDIDREVTYQGKKQRSSRNSRAAIRQRRLTEKGRWHEVPRDFIYVSEERADNLYGPMILDFIFTEI